MEVRECRVSLVNKYKGIYEFTSEEGTKHIDILKEFASHGVVGCSKQFYDAICEAMPKVAHLEHYEYDEYRRHRHYNKGAHRHAYAVNADELMNWMLSAITLIPNETCEVMMPAAKRIVDRINSCKNKAWEATVVRRYIDKLDLSITLYDETHEVVRYGGIYIEEKMSEKRLLEEVTASMNEMLELNDGIVTFKEVA